MSESSLFSEPPQPKSPRCSHELRCAENCADITHEQWALRKIQHVQKAAGAALPTPVLWVLAGQGSAAERKGDSFSPLPWECFITGNFRLRWEKGEPLHALTASSSPSTCSQKRQMWIQKNHHSRGAVGMGMIPGLQEGQRCSLPLPDPCRNSVTQLSHTDPALHLSSL